MSTTRTVIIPPGAGQRGTGLLGLPRRFLAQSRSTGRRIGSWWISRSLAGIAEAERGRFVLWLPVFMGIGVLAYYALRAEPPDRIGAGCGAVGFVAAIAVRNRLALRAACLSVAFAALGF